MYEPLLEVGMNKSQIVRLLILMMVLLPFWGSAAAEGDADMQRFLNVKQWKGQIDLTITDSLSTYRSWEAGHEKRNLSSERSYRFKVQTGDGKNPGVDIFATEPASGAKVEKGDMMYGRDMNQMQQAMKRSGINPAMMGRIMGEMNKIKGLHISANKYKQWNVSSLSANVTGRWNSTDITKGEGLDTAGAKCSYRRSRIVKGGYEGLGGLVLVINLQKQAYSFKWSSNEKKPQTASENIYNYDSCGETRQQTREIAFKNLYNKDAKPLLFEKLPVSGLMLSGTKKFHEESDDGAKRVIELRWTLVPVGSELPEAWIEYEEGGDEWIPEDDNIIKTTLKWSDNITPSQVRFTLYEISEEPGTSLNSEDENTEPDLEFAEENEANGFKIRKSGKSYVAVKEDLSGSTESIVLHAKDFGAYGKLKAEIEVNGHWFEATSKEFELSYLPVPYDKNNNLIADKWEKDVGIYGENLAPDWDEDPYPQGQKHNGDGFTLYEEYRGFQEIGHAFKRGDHEQVKDGHVRMDPMYKDVFIYDRDGLFTQYYKPYNPADLNWHLIAPAMMKRTGSVERNPDYRLVNFNTSKEHFFRNQYAIFVVNKGVSLNTELKNDVGYTPRIPGCSKPMRYSHPLKCLYSVEIYLDTINTWASKAPGTEAEKGKYANDQLTSTVIHELGHAVGIRHHLPKVDQGVKQCAIRYDSNTEMGHPRIFGFLRTRYCKKGETYLTGEADAGGKFKQFPSHNCYGQINLKGD